MPGILPGNCPAAGASPGQHGQERVDHGRIDAIRREVGAGLGELQKS